MKSYNKPMMVEVPSVSFESVLCCDSSGEKDPTTGNSIPATKLEPATFCIFGKGCWCECCPNKRKCAFWKK